MLMAIFEEAMNEVALGDEQASFEWEAVFGPGGGGRLLPLSSLQTDPPISQPLTELSG